MQQHLRWCQQQFSWIQWAETASDRAKSLLPVWSKKRKAETYVEPARWGRQCQQKNVAVVSIQKYFRVFMLENVNYLPPCRFWRVMVHSAWLTGSEGSEYTKNCVETWNSTWFVNVCVVAIGLSQSPTRTFARAEQVGQPLSQTLTYRYNSGDCTKTQGLQLAKCLRWPPKNSLKSGSQTCEISRRQGDKSFCDSKTIEFLMPDCPDGFPDQVCQCWMAAMLTSR